MAAGIEVMVGSVVVLFGVVALVALPWTESQLSTTEGGLRLAATQLREWLWERRPWASAARPGAPAPVLAVAVDVPVPVSATLEPVLIDDERRAA